MKTTIIVAAIAILTASPAFADTTASSNASTQAQSSSANMGVNAVVQSYGSEIPDNTTVKSAPAIGGQGYYGSFSPDTCMVSAGVGVSIVGFGMQGASPVRDDQCAVLRGMVRTSQLAQATRATNPALSAKLTQASVGMLCRLNDTVGAAMQAQGLCPNKPAEKPTPVATAQQPESASIQAKRKAANYYGNDPIVLARLGIK